MSLSSVMKVGIRKGSKVIVRTNNNEPYYIGEVKDFIKFGESGPFPVVNINGENNVVMGQTILYSDLVARILDSLAPEEQWELVCQIRETQKPS